MRIAGTAEMCYIPCNMIVGYGNRLAEKLHKGQRCRFPADVVRRAQRRLTVLSAAAQLNDLRKPPGNRLEALSGDRAGYHSIRINDQWRIVFKWTEDGPDEGEVCDYH